MVDEKIRLTDLHRSNIRNVRKEARIRTDVLSGMINKAPSYISQIESGRIKTITIGDLTIIANTLGHNVDIFLKATTQDEMSNYDRLLMENIELRRENEYLKEKLRSIMAILEK